MPAHIQIEKSDNVTKQQMDWLGAYGNTWAPVKVMPGTCEACTFGDRYKHTCGMEKECGWCTSVGHTLSECTFERTPVKKSRRGDFRR